VFSTRPLWVAFALFYATGLAAQVRIVVPKRQYQPEEQIKARLENRSSRPITICVQFGQWSPKEGTIESTPSPFLVEQRGNGRWSVLLIGPDVGSNSQPVEVGSGKSLDFPFRLRDRGTMRLRLDYWIGSGPDVNCKDPTRGTKRLRSTTFTVG
jgi:hypothetical protein